MAKRNSNKNLDVYWREQIRAWNQSTQTQKAFCEERQLSYHQFGYWRRKFTLSATEHKQSNFVPVSVARPSSDIGLKLTLPTGVCLEGLSSGNLPLVEQLLRLL